MHRDKQLWDWVSDREAYVTLTLAAKESPLFSDWSYGIRQTPHEVSAWEKEPDGAWQEVNALDPKYEAILNIMPPTHRVIFDNFERPADV